MACEQKDGDRIPRNETFASYVRGTNSVPILELRIESIHEGTAFGGPTTGEETPSSTTIVVVGGAHRTKSRSLPNDPPDGEEGGGIPEPSPSLLFPPMKRRLRKGMYPGSHHRNPNDPGRERIEPSTFSNRTDATEDAMPSPTPRPIGIAALFDRVAIAILLLFAFSLWYFFEEKHRERLYFFHLHRKGSKREQRVERPWYRRDSIRGLFHPVQECDDRISECRILSSNGMCSLSYVKDSCMISCGVCDPSRYDTLDPGLADDTSLCFDVISECDLRSEEVGYCESMEAEMKCRESCGLC